jgi:spermidine/putrescine ABC transporter ATP-binding subunit
MADQPTIELIAATKRYGDAVALDAVDLRIMPGEFFCLLGPSGCGKTTTLNLIGGFIPLTAGELRIEGRKVNDLPPHKRNVNTVFQNYALFPHMSIADNIAFGLKMEGLGKDETKRRTGQYLELVGLAGYGNRLPSQLSGGQQQRVALARALVKEPAVLLLDEPLGALDLKLRKAMQTELARIHRQVGTTFVFVTHDQEEALSMATTIAVMSGGRVLQQGSPHDVYDHPANRFVANFIGDTNFLDGTVVAGGSGRVLDVAGASLTVADGEALGSATMMVRPEYVKLRPIVEATAGSGIAGRIANIAFLGNHTRVTVTTSAGDLVAVIPHGLDDTSTDSGHALGEDVFVSWHPNRAALIRD